jgi:hypothetical protein
MSNSEYKISDSTSRKKYPESETAKELLSVSSMEFSPEKSRKYHRTRTGKSTAQSKSNNFDFQENGNSKTITRTNTRGFSGVELESDSIYKGKMLGLEHKELSGAETTSQKHESTLIDKEVKGRLRNSLAIPAKTSKDQMYRVKTSLTLSEDRRMGDLFDPEHRKYLSSGDYTDKPIQPVKKVLVQNIENIDEESAEGTSGRRESRTQQHSMQEHDLREAFIENLREMVTGVFQDLKQELQDSSEIELLEILKERERTTTLTSKFESNGLISEKANELLKEQDQMVVSLSNLLGAQLKQGNKVKGMLIDTLMFLDKQVLEMSKIQRIMDHQRRTQREKTEHYLQKSKFIRYE